MYVCICNAVTETQIRAAAEAGSTDLWSLQTALGVAAGCGTCKEAAAGILAEYRPARPQRRTGYAEPVRYCPAG